MGTQIVGTFQFVRRIANENGVSLSLGYRNDRLSAGCYFCIIVRRRLACPIHDIHFQSKHGREAERNGSLLKMSQRLLCAIAARVSRTASSPFPLNAGLVTR